MAVKERLKRSTWQFDSGWYDEFNVFVIPRTLSRVMVESSGELRPVIWQGFFPGSVVEDPVLIKPFNDFKTDGCVTLVG